MFQAVASTMYCSTTKPANSTYSLPVSRASANTMAPTSRATSRNVSDRMLVPQQAGGPDGQGDQEKPEGDGRPHEGP